MSSDGRPANDVPWRYEVLRQRLTPDRLGSYLAAASGDLAAAFAHYEWNLEASAAVLMTTGMVEVVVRNSLDRELTVWAGRRAAGGSWFSAAPLDAQGRSDIDRARARATRHGRRVEVHGQVVAELNLGFWRYLTASRYLTSLWTPALHAAFPLGPTDIAQRRIAVEDRLQRLTFVRNRAAHHEPIHRRHLGSDLEAAVEVTGWLCADSAAWVDAKSPLLGVIARRPAFDR